MNFNIYTQKSLEAVQAAQNIARQNNHQQMEQVHLLLALLQQDGGLIPQLLRKMGVVVESLQAAAQAELRKLPGVTGAREADKIYISNDLNQALIAAQDRAAHMKDDFISVEHLLLGLLDTAQDGVKSLFNMYRITADGVMKALQAVRGNQRVTSDSPEGTYDALEKYGTDLVKRARHLPTELSGGQQQRVAIARAIVTRPSLILADEPTGNLDSKTTCEIMEIFHELHQGGNTIVLITHDNDVAGQASRIVNIRDGRLSEVKV